MHMSARVAPRLPLEITEMCLRLCTQLERERHGVVPLKQIGLLRLVSRHFRDVFIKELFNSVLLYPFSVKRRAVAFLTLVHENTDILKHVCHVTIRFNRLRRELSQVDVEKASSVVRIFSKAPLTTLTVDGLDKNFQCPPIFNALHTLRCIPSLQTLYISGSAVPPFLVCGHFAATRLKSIQFPCYSSPDELTSEHLQPHLGLSIGPDSILASGFQPFADIEVLDVPNGADVPKYFPLQDFGSPYYASNGRLPFTLPALRKLSIGSTEPWEDETGMPLDAEDYRVLGTLLSRAPRLETLCIIDRFGHHHGVHDFAPLVDQLPSMKNLNRLDLADPGNKRDGAINSISNLLGAFPPIHTLKTLRIDFQWSMENVEATRASLYFSQAWVKLQRALASPALASLQVLILGIGIEIVHEDRYEETFGPEEADAFKGTLLNLYAQDGKLDVTVDIEVIDL